MNPKDLLFTGPRPAAPSMIVSATPMPPLPTIQGAKSLHWQVAPPQYNTVPPGFWQLVIDGMPMAEGYEQPVSDRWDFRPGAGGGNIWRHLERLADIAQRAGVIVEIGIATCTGSTHAFDLGLQKSTAPVRCHIGVDLHEAPNPDWAPQNRSWRYVKGDSREASTVDAVRDLLTWARTDGYPGDVQPVDVIYIDTIHEYEFLQRELANWETLAGDHTTWLFHDTYLHGTRHHLTDAIEEFAAEHVDRWQYVSLSEICSGLGALIPLRGGIL